MPRDAEPTAPDRNVAIGSNGEKVPTVTAAAAWCVNPAVSKAALRPWTFDHEVVSESRVTWTTSVPISVFRGLAVLDLGPMHATNRRQTDRRQTASELDAPAY